MRPLRIIAALLLLASCGPEISSDRIAGGDGAAEEVKAFTAKIRQAYADNALMRFEDAETAYREASLIAGRLFPDDAAGQAEQQLHLALNRSNRGDFELAESLFVSARPTVAQTRQPLLRMKAAIFYAQHLLNQGDAARAEAEAAEALRIAEAARQRAGVAGVPDRGAGRADFTLTEEDAALLNASAGDSEGAELEIGRLSPREKLAVLETHANYVLASARRAQGRDGSAAMDRAAALLDEAPGSAATWLRSAVYLALGRAAESRGDLDEALRLTERGLSAARRFAAGDRPEALAHLQRGRILLAQGRAGPGREAYRDAVAILRQGGRGVSYAAMAPYIDLLTRNPGLDPSGEEAFLALQQLRSPVTSDTLARLAARLSAGDDAAADAIRRFQDSEREVNRLTARIDLISGARPLDRNALEVARRRLVEQRAAYAAAKADLASSAPNYEQILDASVPLGALQSQLREGEVFVLTRLGPSSGVVGAVTSRGFRLAQIPQGEPAIAELVGRVRDSVYSVAFDVEAARALHVNVLEPLGRLVADADALIVAPDGPLLSMPVGLYVAEEPRNWSPGSTDFSAVPWLGTRKPVSLTMSPQSFVRLRGAAPSDASRDFRGFADFQPYGPGNARTVLARRGVGPECLEVLGAVGSLPRLPGTVDEVEALRRIFGAPASDVTIGAAFTDEATKRAPLDEYRILHFASQGLLPISEECLPEPALATSLGGRESDGLLEAGEIVDLKIDSDLVVLSACDTGGQGADSALGTGLSRNRGESLSGLVRAFFYAGARNVVASHWLVPDVETVQLMVGFYEAVDAGASPAEAMRLTRAKLAGDPLTSHPFFWSSFSVIGDGGRRIPL